MYIKVLQMVNLRCSRINLPISIHSFYFSTFQPYGCFCWGSDFSLLAIRHHAAICCWSDILIYLYSVCKPRADIRVRVRRCVIRIRKNETAIRVRIVVRPTDTTAFEILYLFLMQDVNGFLPPTLCALRINVFIPQFQSFL